MKWLFFGIGAVVGGVIGALIICLCIVNGDESRREEALWGEWNELESL